MEGKKSDTINKKYLCQQSGFILPMVMIIMLLFAFYTVNAIEHLNNDRDFLKARKLATSIDLQKKIAVFDLVALISKGIPNTKNGQMNYTNSYVTYEITEPQIGTEMVKANLYMGKHHDSFSFLFNETTQRITKWVD